MGLDRLGSCIWAPSCKLRHRKRVTAMLRGKEPVPAGLSLARRCERPPPCDLLPFVCRHMQRPGNSNTGDFPYLRGIISMALGKSCIYSFRPYELVLAGCARTETNH